MADRFNGLYGIDRIEPVIAYREMIKSNIEYNILVERYGEERLDEAVELMLEVVLSKRPYIRIAGDDFPREVVKNRFLNINPYHLEYVFDCIDKNTTKVGNIKAYLLAAMYNARRQWTAITVPRSTMTCTAVRRFRASFFISLWEGREAQ